MGTIQLQKNKFLKKFITCYAKKLGDSDVGDIIMLVTKSRWRFVDIGNRISMLMTSFECRGPKLM